jgi:transposase
MRKKIPTITENAAELVRRMQDDPDRKKRQRLHALYLVASGQARYRKEVSALLHVHRHSVAAWVAAYTVGGLEQALRYNVPQPTRARRLTDTARAALKAQLQTSSGFPSYGHIRTWLAEQHQVQLSYSSVYALVRGALRAKPKRPRPTKRTQQLAGNRDRLPVKVFAQDETRLGLQPILRRRITACGVRPVATVWPRFDNFYLFGAVEPTTGDSFFLELPLLNSAMFQLWLDDFAQTLPRHLTC